MKTKRNIIFILLLLLFTTACSNCNYIKCNYENNVPEETNDFKNFFAISGETSIEKINGKEYELRRVFHSNSEFNWSILMPIPYTFLEQDIIDSKLKPDIPDFAYFLTDASQTISFKKYDITSFGGYSIKYFANLKYQLLNNNFNNTKMVLLDIEGHDVWKYTYQKKHMSYQTLLFEDNNYLFAITYDYLTVSKDYTMPIANYSFNSLSFKHN